MQKTRRGIERIFFKSIAHFGGHGLEQKWWVLVDFLLLKLDKNQRIAR